MTWPSWPYLTVNLSVFDADKLPREHHTLQHPLATIGDLVDAEVCELVSPAGGIQSVVMVKAECLCQ